MTEEPQLSDHLDHVRETYLSSDHVSPDIPFERFVPVGQGQGEQRRQRLLKLTNALEEISPCSIAFETLRDGIETAPTGSNRLTYYEFALAYAGVLVDVTTKYPDIDRVGVTRSLNRGVRGDPDVGMLARAGEGVVDLTGAVTAGETLLDWLDPYIFTHPDDTTNRLRSLVKERIETGTPNAVRGFRHDLETAQSREWTRSDLLAFDPIDFERLLAACWREYRNAAETTRARQDKGVDVIVKTRDGDRLLVQAKRYSPGNTVGIPEVQRVAGLLEQFEVDRVVVVTSSTFTTSATDSAADMERVSLVDGDRLCRWLTNSSLAPPLTIE